MSNVAEIEEPSQSELTNYPAISTSNQCSSVSGGRGGGVDIY